MLVVGKDDEERRRLQHALALNGYEVLVASDLAIARTVARGRRIDAALYVAIAEPAVSVVRELRLHVWGAPLVALTRSEEDRAVHDLLAAGADDCWPRHYRDAEIIARLNALRTHSLRLTMLPVFPDRFALDIALRRLWKTDVELPKWVSLPKQEFVVVRALALDTSVTLSHEEIDYILWGRHGNDMSVARYRLIGRVNVRLRALGGIAVHNDHGIGYRLALE